MSNISKIDGLIIAAGLSTRIGTPKALLEYNGFNFLTNILMKLLHVCENVVIVTGHKNEEVEESFRKIFCDKKRELISTFNFTEKDLQKIDSRISFVKNINYESGMFSSLQTGLKVLENFDKVIYHFVDQPTLPQSFYKNYVEELQNEDDWLQPMYEGRKGHPIIFSKNVADKIIASSVNNNLRDINKELNKRYWDCNYKEIHHDIDTIPEYENIVLKN